MSNLNALLNRLVDPEEQPELSIIGNDEDNQVVDPFAIHEKEATDVGNEVMTAMPLPDDKEEGGESASAAAAKGIYSADLLDKTFNPNGGNLTQTKRDETGDEFLENTKKELDASLEEEIAEALSSMDSPIDTAVPEYITEQTEILDKIDGLVEMNSRMEQLGGISRDMVESVESLVPGCLTGKVNIALYSREVTATNLRVSKEGLGKTLVDLVRKLIAAIRNTVTRGWLWTKDWFVRGGNNTNPGPLKEIHTKVLNLAQEIQSNMGYKYLDKRRQCSDANATKSDTMLQYVTYCMDGDINRYLSPKWTKGMNSVIVNDNFSASVSGIIGFIETHLKTLTNEVNNLSNRATDEWETRDSSNFSKALQNAFSYYRIKVNPGDLRQACTEYSASLKAENAERCKNSSAKTMVDAINFNSPFEKMEKHLVAILEKTAGDMDKTLKKLEEKLLKSDKDTNKAVQNLGVISNELRALNDVIHVLDLSRRRYTSYCKAFYSIMKNLHGKLLADVRIIRNSK